MAFLPELPPSDLPSSEAPLQLRYEDVCQDGRMTTLGMPHALVHVWQKTADVVPLQQLRRAGIVPILSHLWIEGSEEPMLLGSPTHSRGQAALAHTIDDEGQVNRLLLDFRLELFATRGRSIGARPEGAGEQVQVGSVYARHVFTKPFAAAGARKVLRFSTGGLPELPAASAEWKDFTAMLPLALGAKKLDTQLQSSADVAFGLHHCDSNQHVNSLVYPRLFEDAAQMRLVDLDAEMPRLSRQVAVAFRKPFFVGNRASIGLEVFAEAQDRAAIGSFGARAISHPHATPSPASPHCQLAMRFR